MRRVAEQLFVAVLVLSALVAAVQFLQHALWRSEDPSAWWGRRPHPIDAGGDYVEVLSSESSRNWTSSFALGAILEQEHSRGAHIERVIVPVDSRTLFLAHDVSTAKRADGSRIEKERSVFRQDVAQRLTSVRLESADYSPVLSLAQLRTLERSLTITEVGCGFSIMRMRGDSSGVWVLHADPRQDSHFYLIPIELSPIGDHR